MSNIVVLTAYSGTFHIIGWVALVLGKIMDVLYDFLSVLGIQNIGVTIILFTFVIYTCMFPLTYKQQKFSKLSAKMSPELKALQNRYKNKKDSASQQKMMEEQREIYDKYGISPTGSCLQLLIQMPILFALYRVIYNVPAYVTQVKEVFMPAVNGIMGVSNYQGTFDSVIEGFNISLKNIGVSDPAISAITDNTELQNRIVDILYKLTPSNWSGLADSFPSISDAITSVQQSFEHINTFLMLNIAESPQGIIVSSWKSGSYLLVILALMIPLLSGATQLINFKMIPQQAPSGEGDMMAQQMKMMNYMMPLFSMIMCFTLPVGMGIYWIAGAIIRSVYQLLLNKHFDKIDLNDVIEKNKEKASKKKEKRGLKIEQMNQAAQMNTRSIKNSNISEAERDEKLKEAAEKRNQAAPGSLAARANMVKDFNEKNNKK